jgi:alkylation response protein AidB-like acyl-CoA dehydrogenase
VGDSLVTDFQGIQWMIADSWASLQGASLARDHAALAQARGQDIALETSLAKRLAIEAAELASNTSYSLVGGHGLYFDEPYTDIVNDIKVLKVAGGSSEILRNYLARRILKDPAHEGVA